MDFVDIIITKGGGITISEALSKGLAIVTVESIPGQEERNEKYLLGKQAIIRAEQIEKVGIYITSLLGDRHKLQALKTRASEISSADSSLKIADLILRIN
jgi:processive 1,2-diacylglycerol beta-glucosyltransferase